jgi:hypothetical protein
MHCWKIIDAELYFFCSFSGWLLIDNTFDHKPCFAHTLLIFSLFANLFLLVAHSLFLILKAEKVYNILDHPAYVAVIGKIIGSPTPIIRRII